MHSNFVYRNSGGVRRTMIPIDHDNFVVKTEVDMSAVVQHNADLRELHPVRSTNKLVARVPMTVYEKSILEGWDDNDWKRWLNDPQNEPFRVWRGQV